MWGGRFAEPLDPRILEFTASFAVDRRLLPWDVLASVAHARMLGDAGIIPAADAQAITDGLLGILADVDAGHLAVEGPFEDVHSFIETTLYDRIGAAAGRLHTARSRNDQVVTAFRLYVKAQLVDLVRVVSRLMEHFLRLAETTRNIVLPGYTHLQHAQPILLAHHLLAYVWMLERDTDRLKECYRRTDVLPLGAGAVAGVSFPIDRLAVARMLGFARISENSLDAAGDRDFALDVAFAAATLMIHLSRWAGEIVLWASEEFGFLTLADSVATGSSLMPQKKNPDVAELIRGSSGRVIGALTALLATVKGLPAGYQGDLQEDKRLTFEAVDASIAAVTAMDLLLDHIQFHPEQMAAATRKGLLTATEVADYLVRKGVPFREAHGMVGQLVQVALTRGCQLWDLPYEVYREVSSLFERDVLTTVTVEAAVEAKRAPGGTAPASVDQQLVRAHAQLEAIRAWLTDASAAASRPRSLARRA